MSDTHPCDRPCELACADACALQAPAAGPPIDLEEALARFGREAARGVCDTGRYRMPYFVWGQGPPLVLVHGLGDCSRSFVAPVSRLSAHFRCVGYDLPAGGADGARVRRYTHAGLVDDLWALLDHLGLRQAYLLGSSFGSTVVLAAMARRPERVPRGVLQGGLAYRPLTRRERFVARVASFLPGAMTRLPGRERLLEAVSGRDFAGRPPGAWRHYLDCAARGPIATFASQALLVQGLDLRPLLPAIRQPVLLVCGDQDRVLGRAFEEALLAGLPNAGRVTIEGCGHVPSYTHPEVLAEVVRQFLTPPSANGLSR
jgi:pimeloyl-ACP methyl ester carboxylesterase